MSDTKTLVAVATYNEIETLPTLVEAIQQQLPGADILVVDDNSPDGTGRWCDARAATDQRVTCLHRPGKLGLGSATVAAFGHAIDRGYESVVTMDADWSHDPDALPALVAGLNRADVAIGSRYCRGGRIDGWPVHRRVASRLMNWASRLALGVPASDTSGAFRAYRVESLKRIDLGDLQETGYAYLEEIVWRLHHAGAAFTETPITFRDRRAGASKTGLGELGGKLRMLARFGFRRPPAA
ncbi:MAG: polyprenol monophosphomannose synthase [Planctomycetota bacterium]